RTYTYSWSPTSETTPVIETLIEGDHIVTTNVTFGSTTCTNKDTVNLRNVCPPRIYVPNVFTPGVDGPNKIFTVFGAHFTNYKLMVFNRWGEIIFVSTDRNQGWDGMYKGEMMPVGIYPYIIEYEGLTEETKGPYKLEGEVLILR
ncbi:MAG: gliding motility-associated C-terminal domain-containing protein, partial [Cytophagaceae bacterium]|nr:gliding motility-associated C-terminal domain-containing protein [Cytophagaceae bacterium]MDW8456768.1 gliding motility-associated C-terminal domain-containing protein [Cytophagaceae bacterium]